MLNLEARWRRVTNTTARPLYPRERTIVPSKASGQYQGPSVLPQGKNGGI
jgi:hypothetical protein